MSRSKNSILSEELLVPNGPARSDAYRLVMWAANVPQIIPLVETDIPRIQTGFENQIGSRSKGISYITAKDDSKVIEKISKYDNNEYYDLILVKDKTIKKDFLNETGNIVAKNKKVYDVISVRPINKLTENYGYKMHTVNDKKVGSKVKSDELIVRSAEYDDNLNMKYGRNAKIAYSPFNNATYEDAIVISKSFSERMATYRVEKTVAVIPNNSILIEHESTQRALWKVGEVIDDTLLLISRSVNDNLIVSSSNNSAIGEARYSDRRTYSNGGKVVDIEIFAKRDQIKDFDKRGGFYKEIYDIYENNKKYYLSVVNALEELDLYPREVNEDGSAGHFIDKVKLPHYTTPELDFLYKEAKEWLNEDSIWLTNKSEPINNIALRYTVLKSSDLETGGKLVGRYGNKGVASYLVKDDEDMPKYYNHLGEEKTVDVFLNFLGIWGRQNPAQIFEQYLTFIMDNLADKCSTIEDITVRTDYFFSKLMELDNKYGKFMFEEYKKLTPSERNDFWVEVFDHKFPFVMDPFEDVIDWIDIANFQKNNPELTKLYETNDGRNILVGEQYIIRLKHDTENKSSRRSTGKGSVIDGSPVDSSKERKVKQILMSSKAARFGVMEFLNLEILNDEETLRKFYAINGKSQKVRTQLVRDILTKGEVFSSEMELEEFLEDKTNTRIVLDQYLSVLNLKIED